MDFRVLCAVKLEAGLAEFRALTPACGCAGAHPGGRRELRFFVPRQPLRGQNALVS